MAKLCETHNYVIFLKDTIIDAKPLCEYEDTSEPIDTKTIIQIYARTYKPCFSWYYGIELTTIFNEVLEKTICDMIIDLPDTNFKYIKYLQSLGWDSICLRYLEVHYRIMIQFRLYRSSKARTIQKCMKLLITNPNSELCKKRLMTEWKIDIKEFSV